MNMQRHDELIDQWNSESAPAQSTPHAAGEAAHTPMADKAAFSTGNAFVVLHEDAQRIERDYRAKNEKLMEVIREAARWIENYRSTPIAMPIGPLHAKINAVIVAGRSRS